MDEVCIQDGESIFPHFFEILVILFEQLGGIQAVGTFPGALVAMLAILYLFHLLRPFGRQVNAERGPLEEKAHAVAVVDFNAGRAGFAVTASSAKVARKFLAVLFNLVPAALRELGRVLLESQEFIQFPFPLDTPDRHHMFKLRQVGVGGCCVGDEAAGQGFHGDKAHLVGFAHLHYFKVIFGSQVGERKLQCFVKS